MSETLTARFDGSFNDSYQEWDPEDLEAIQRNERLFRMYRADAVEFGGSSLFFARQLDYVKSRIYNRKFPAMNADVLVPDATDTPEWAQTISIHSYDSVGMAKIIANYADDLPRADVRAMVQMVPVKMIGDSFGYNIEEIIASRAIGAGLDARKADAARRAVDIKIAKIKLVGDADYGLFGLFNLPNIPIVVLPNLGPWGALSGAQIFANLSALKFAFDMQCIGTHTANFLALAPEAYYAATTQLFQPTTNQPMTALQLFLAQNPGITAHNIWEMAAPSPGPDDVALLYEHSPDNLAHEYVKPFTMLPPEARNLEFVINCIAKSGGVHLYYPLAFVSAITS
jgi:hypothetical protein